jgi:hypothetical protein
LVKTQNAINRSNIIVNLLKGNQGEKEVGEKDPKKMNAEFSK